MNSSARGSCFMSHSAASPSKPLANRRHISRHHACSSEVSIFWSGQNNSASSSKPLRCLILRFSAHARSIIHFRGSITSRAADDSGVLTGKYYENRNPERDCNNVLEGVQKLLSSRFSFDGPPPF